MKGTVLRRRSIWVFPTNEMKCKTLFTCQLRLAYKTNMGHLNYISNNGLYHRSINKLGKFIKLDEIDTIEL